MDVICPRCDKRWPIATLHREAQARFEERHPDASPADSQNVKRGGWDYAAIFSEVVGEFGSAGCTALPHAAPSCVTYSRVPPDDGSCSGDNSDPDADPRRRRPEKWVRRNAAGEAFHTYVDPDRYPAMAADDEAQWRLAHPDEKGNTDDH